MNGSRRFFIIIETVMGLLVLLLASMMLGERDRDVLGKISVIVSDSDDARWAAFKYGARMAAEDRGIEVVIVGTEGTVTLPQEENLIRNAIDDGADAVIVQPVSGADADDIRKAAGKRTPVILIGRPLTENGQDPGLPVAEPDEYAMGASLAEELLKDYSGNMEDKSIGILSRTTDSAVTGRRLEGFQSVLEKTGAELEWHIAGNFDESGTDFLKNLPRVDAVAALDDYSLRAAGECAAAGGLGGALIYGVGHSTQAIYYLDSGAVECLAVPDEFNIGYQSMDEMADCLQYMFHRAESREVSYTVMRRETLFSDENQEILFTMSQ